MKWFLPLLLVLQEPSPVPPLLAKIDGRDPAICFRAIADLSDLDARYRPEINKGAVALPEFYRDALLAELKVPASSLRRVTWKGDERTVRAHLEDLGRQSGLQFDLRWCDRSQDNAGLIESPFSLSVKASPALEALAAICSKGLLAVDKGTQSDALQVSQMTSRVWAFGHRSAMVLHRDGWVRKWIDFSGRPEWTSYLHFTAVLGPEAHIWGWKDVRVMEAVSEKGADLRLDPASRDESAADFKEGPTEPWDWFYRGFTVGLKLPEGVGHLERIRLAAVARVATRVRTLEIKGIAGSGKGSLKEGDIETDLVSVERRTRHMYDLLLRLKSKTIKAEDLDRLPLQIELKSAAGWESAWHTSRVAGDAVECEIIWEVETNQDSPPEGEENGVLKGVRLQLADGLEERTIFAEFRGLPLR